MTMQSRLIGVVLTLVITAGASGVVLRAHDRLPFQGSLQTTSRLVFPGQAGYRPDCDGAPMLDVVGVGLATYLGATSDRQSHCLGTPQFDATGQVTGIPFFNGRFTFSDGRGRTVRGKYEGLLRPTFNSTLSEQGPGGQWTIDGRVCVNGGTLFGGLVDDCAAGRSFPALGMSNFVNNEASVIIDQTIGVAERRDSR